MNEMTNKVKAVLGIAGKKQNDYAEALGITKQSMYNKMQTGYWNVDDIIRLMDMVNGELVMRCKGTEIRVGNECIHKVKGNEKLT